MHVSRKLLERYQPTVGQRLANGWPTNKRLVKKPDLRSAVIQPYQGCSETVHTRFPPCCCHLQMAENTAIIHETESRQSQPIDASMERSTGRGHPRCQAKNNSDGTLANARRNTIYVALEFQRLWHQWPRGHLPGGFRLMDQGTEGRHAGNKATRADDHQKTG